MCFSLIWLLSRDRRPHSLLRKHICVCCHSQRQSEDVPCLLEAQTFQRETASACRMQWALKASVHDSVLFPLFVSSSYMHLPKVHPYSFCLWVWFTHLMATFHFTAGGEREKSHLILWLFRSGVSWEAPWSVVHSGLKPEFILGEEVRWE